ncbi:protein kinase domain-containing protein [Anaerotignum sp.]
MLLNPGTVLSGRYEILEKIGSGGMAVVYRGKDRKLDRYVTIKVLREEFIGDEEFIERFRSEACSAARLSHPNIVRAYDVGDDGDISYIVNEYIHGDTLKKAIKEKAPFDSRSTINVAIQIASALSQAHKAHIVHRDIKPQNILVGTDGVVKVTDFGIARAATASTMTTTANAAGSVHYFSPEQARGGYVDEKSDIYSLGISMFEMITGVLPFQGNNSVSIALMHINDELPDIRQYNPNCTPSLEGIIKKATMKKADERYANIDLLLADLIRARADITGAGKREQPVEKKEEPAKEAAAAAAGAGVRMSRRAEAAAQLRAAQEKAAAEKAAQEAQETPQETKPADPKELEAIRMAKKAEPVLEKEPEFQEMKIIPKPIELGEDQAEEEEGDVYTPLVGFDKYSKKLPQISKEDEYESEYVASEKVKTSRRPERVRRNPRAEADYDNEHDRKTERKVILAAVITALVIIGIISAVGIKFLGGGFSGFGGFSAEEGGMETPLFIGVPYEDAVKAAEEMGIILVEEGEDYSSFYDTGYIIYQSVSEGTPIKEGTKIGVKISLGLTEEEMPNVEGKKEKDALEAIIRLVGDVAQREYVYDPEADPMTVIKQEPAAGEMITAKSKIVLTISKGDEDSSVVVPNVVNETLESAKSSLEAVGLTVGSVSEAASDRVAAGKVITQTVAANSEVSRGSVVNLVVSTGAGGSESSAPSAGNSQSNAQGTKYFTINAPANASGSVYVRVVKNDVDGAFPVVDEYRDASEFPYSVPVTGKGSGSVSCYLNGAEQWTQSVNFGD